MRALHPSHQTRFLTKVVFVPTGPSRCLPFWQELLGCYVVNSADGDAGKKKCAGPMDDYYECLHHKKEVSSSVPLARWLKTGLLIWC